MTQYGVGSDYQRSNPEGWSRNAEPLVKTHLEELARFHHAGAQKSKKSEDYQEAVRWYRSYLTSFPQDPQAAQNNFLLAELLYEDARYSEAAVEYEKSAYGYPQHAKSADAGYAALLAYAQQEKRLAAPDVRKVQLAAVDSALRFVEVVPAGPAQRTGADQRRRKAVCAERRPTRQRGRAPGARPAAAAAGRSATRGLDRAWRTRRSRRARLSTPSVPMARSSR